MFTKSCTQWLCNTVTFSFCNMPPLRCLMVDWLIAHFSWSLRERSLFKIWVQRNGRGQKISVQAFRGGWGEFQCTEIWRLSWSTKKIALSAADHIQYNTSAFANVPNIIGHFGMMKTLLQWFKGNLHVYVIALMGKGSKFQCRGSEGGGANFEYTRFSNLHCSTPWRR